VGRGGKAIASANLGIDPGLYAAVLIENEKDRVSIGTVIPVPENEHPPVFGVDDKSPAEAVSHIVFPRIHGRGIGILPLHPDSLCIIEVTHIPKFKMRQFSISDGKKCRAASYGDDEDDCKSRLRDYRCIPFPDSIFDKIRTVFKV
jgi:hypothetical protein